MNKICSKCCEHKPTNAFGNQRRSKDGLSAWCKPCKKFYNSSWFKNNRESENERIRDWYEENKEKKSKSNTVWQYKNKGLVNAATAKRRALKKLAMPKWLSNKDIEAIKLLYRNAAEMTKANGIRYEVDHIVPIQGNNVCGLHVPWNMQILTKSENLSKGNRMSNNLKHIKGL